MARSGLVDPNTQLGSGIDYIFTTQPDDTVRFRRFGMVFPSVVVDPSGQVLVGNGTIAPTPLGTGGGASYLAGTGLSLTGVTFAVDLATIVDKTTTQTLTHKTLTAPAISSPTGLVKADVGLSNVLNSAQLIAASNLADLADAAAARTNLGLGAAALLATPIPVTAGGTAGITAAAAFNNLAPTLLRGDIPVMGNASSNVALGLGAGDTLLSSNGLDPVYITAPQNLTGLGIGAVPSLTTANSAPAIVNRTQTQSTNIQSSALRVNDARTIGLTTTDTANGNAGLTINQTPAVSDGVTAANITGLNIQTLPTIPGTGVITGSMGIRNHCDSLATTSHFGIFQQFGTFKAITRATGIHVNAFAASGTGTTIGTLTGMEINAGPINFLGGGLATTTHLYGLLVGNGVGQQDTTMINAIAGLVGIGGANTTTAGATQSVTAPTYGLHMMATSGSAGAIGLAEQTSTPANPPTSAGVVMYHKSDAIVFAFLDGAQIRYKSLTLSGTGVTWVHSTTAP